MDQSNIISFVSKQHRSIWQKLTYTFLVVTLAVFTALVVPFMAPIQSALALVGVDNTVKAASFTAPFGVEKDSFVTPSTSNTDRHSFSVGRSYWLSDTFYSTWGLIKFNPINLEPQAVVKSAWIEVWVRNSFNGGADIPVYVQRVLNDWPETGSTAYPAVDGTTYGSAYLGNFTITINGNVPRQSNIPVSADLVNYLRQPNNGITIRRSGGDDLGGVHICSSEGGSGCGPEHAPRLVVEYIVNDPPYTPIPTAPTHQRKFSGNCDESVIPATGSCRTGLSTTLTLDGVGDGNEAPGRHREVHFAGTNQSTGQNFDTKQDIILSAGQKVSRSLTQNFADGKYNWFGYSIDEQNRRGENSVKFDFTVDTTPPAIPELQDMPDFVQGVGIEEAIQFEPKLVTKVADNISPATQIGYITQYSTDPTFANNTFTKELQTFNNETAGRFEIGPKGIDEIAGTADDIVEESTYYFRVKSVDELGNTSKWSDVVSSAVDATAPVVTDVTATPVRISPQNASSVGAYDTLNFSFKVTEKYTKEVGYEILNNQYQTIFKYTETPAQQQLQGITFSYAWDGKNEDGEIISDGSYIIKPVATDLAGNGITIKESDHQRLFIIDNAGVQINFNQLADLWVNKATQKLTGQVIDVGDLKSFLMWNANSNAWENFAGISEAQYDENSDQFSLDTILNNGLNTFIFKTIDLVDNTETFERKLNLDQSSPSINAFILKNAKNGEDVNLLDSESVKFNDKAPQLQITLTDQGSGIRLGNNPQGITLSMEFQYWQRDTQSFRTEVVELIKNGVNVNPNIITDLACAAANGANTYTRNGVATSEQVNCTATLKQLGDTAYKFKLVATDLTGNSTNTQVSRDVVVDAFVYNELRAPRQDGSYSTQNVKFIGFASRHAELVLRNSAADVDLTIRIEEGAIADEQYQLKVVCGTFINHDNDAGTPDEEVCRWELVVPQDYDPVAVSTPNVTLVKVSDDSGNSESINVTTNININNFALSVSASAAYVSPNGDGYQDQVSFIHFAFNPDDPFNQPQVKNYLLEIKNADGEIVKQYQGEGSIPAFSQWDLQIIHPEDDTKTITVPDGIYTFVLTATSADDITKQTSPKQLHVNAQLTDKTVISTPLTGTNTTNGVVTIQGQAPATVPADSENTKFRGQVYANICVDALVPEGKDVPAYISLAEAIDTTNGAPKLNYGQGNVVECDHWQEVLVDENGFFSTIILFPQIEGLDKVTHAITAYSRDDFGNSTPNSNKVEITLDSADPFIEVSLSPTLTGITSPADYEKFLNGQLTIDDIRALRVRSVVTKGTEQVELAFADYINLKQRPDAPEFNHIATLTDLKESDAKRNPLNLDNIKLNHNKSLGDNTIPYNNCDKEEGCVWDYLVPLNDEFGGIYEVNFKGKRGTVIDSMTRGFQVDGRIPAAPVFMVVEKWDAVNNAWVKMENISYDNFTDTGKIRFRGAAEPGTKVELWTADTVDEEGNVTQQGVKFVDMIVGNTGVWEFILELEDYLNNGGSIDDLPGGPGDDGQECSGLECLRAKLGFILKGYKVDRNGTPVQVDENGNPEIVESEGTVTVNYDRTAPQLTKVERKTPDNTIQGWTSTGTQTLFNITVDEAMLTSELIKEDGFVRLLSKINEQKDSNGVIVGETWTATINVDDPAEGIYNVAIRVKDLAENTRRYTADRHAQYKVDDFRIFIDNTAPDATSIINNSDEWSQTWEQGGINSGIRYATDPSTGNQIAYQLQSVYEQGRTNPAYVTKANAVSLRGRAEYGQRIEIYVGLPQLDTDGNLVNSDQPLAETGGSLIKTINVSEQNCVAYDYDKVTADGLTTKYNVNCDWALQYTFPDDGANNSAGVPLNGYVFQARVLDKAANKSDWSNTVVMYHDTQKPINPYYAEIKSAAYGTDSNIPGFSSGLTMQTSGALLPITKDTNIAIRTNAERFSDFVFNGVKSGQSTPFVNNKFINDSTRVHVHNVDLGSTQRDERDGCMTMQGKRRVGTCEDGVYAFTSKVTDAVGQSSDAVTVAVERDTVSPVKPDVNVYMQGLYNINMSVSGEPNASGSTVGPLGDQGAASGRVFTLDLYNDSHWERWFTFCSSQTDRAGNLSAQACDSVFTPVRPTRPGECDSSSAIEAKYNEVLAGRIEIPAGSNIHSTVGFSRSCLTYELDKLNALFDQLQTSFNNRQTETYSCIDAKTKAKEVDTDPEPISYEEAIAQCDTGKVLGAEAVNNMLYQDKVGDFYNCIYKEVTENKKKSEEAYSICGGSTVFTGDSEENTKKLIKDSYAEIDKAIDEQRAYDEKPWHEKLVSGIGKGISDFANGMKDLVEGAANALYNAGKSIVEFVGNTIEAGASLINNAAAGLAAMAESALTGADLSETFLRNQQTLASMGFAVNDPLQDLQQIGTALAVTAAIAAAVAVAVVAAPLVMGAVTSMAGYIGSFGAVQALASGASAVGSAIAGIAPAVGGAVGGLFGTGAVAGLVTTATTFAVSGLVTLTGAIVTDLGINAGIAGVQTVVAGGDFATNFANVTCGGSDGVSRDFATCAGYVLGGSLSGESMAGALSAVPNMYKAASSMAKASGYLDELTQLGRIGDNLGALSRIDLPNGLKWANIPTYQIDEIIAIADQGVKVDLSKLSDMSKLASNLGDYPLGQLTDYFTVLGKGIDDVDINALSKLTNGAMVDGMSQLASMSAKQTQNLLQLVATKGDEMIDLSKLAFAGDNLLKYGDELLAAAPNGGISKLDDLEDLSHIANELNSGKFNFGCVLGLVAEAPSSRPSSLMSIFVPPVYANTRNCDVKQITDKIFLIDDIPVKGNIDSISYLAKDTEALANFKDVVNSGAKINVDNFVKAYDDYKGFVDDVLDRGGAFTDNTYAKWFKELVGEAPSYMDNPQVHHLIPQTILNNPDLAGVLNRAGINIHDPKLLSYWNSPSHQTFVDFYQATIEGILDQYKNMPTVNADEILNEIRKANDALLRDNPVLSGQYSGVTDYFFVK